MSYRFYYICRCLFIQILQYLGVLEGITMSPSTAIHLISYYIFIQAINLLDISIIANQNSQVSAY